MHEAGRTAAYLNLRGSVRGIGTGFATYQRVAEAQETDALRDFDLAYDRLGSKPAQMPMSALSPI